MSSDTTGGSSGDRKSGAEERGPTDIPEESASSESELSLSNQVAQREDEDQR